MAKGGILYPRDRREFLAVTSHESYRSSGSELRLLPVRWATLVACACLAGLVLAVARADRLASADPKMALLMAPWHSSARVAEANVRLQQSPPDTAGAIQGIKDALRLDPLVPQAFDQLAQAYEAAGDAASAYSAWEAAGRVWLRNSIAQAILLERDLNIGRADNAFARLDILLRSDPQTGVLILRNLTNLLADRTFSGALERGLEANPPWRATVLRDLAENAANLGPVANLYRRLDKSSSPPSDAEIRPLLGRLVAAERYEEAFILWLESGKRDPRAQNEFLYNARFHAPISNMPFDWTFDPTPGANMRVEGTGARRNLVVEFFGSRIGFQNISQWLLLPPGAFTFSGIERADGVMSDRGVRWRIACANDLGGELASTPALTGSTPWREFSVSFTVPPTCRAQRLVLEVPARVVLERVISGRVSYSNLSLNARLKTKP